MQNKKSSSIINFFESLTTKKILLLFCLIGLIVFSNTLFNNFIEDDKKYIIDYPLLHQVNLAFTFGPNYFSILYSLFSTTPFFYHLLQIILHIAVTVFVYFIFSKFLSKSISFFGSLVFLVHPMNVESVAYIAQTVSPLFTLFGFISFFLLIKEEISTKTAIIGYSLLLLSILTKETGIIFVFLILLYRFLFVDKYKQFFKLSIGIIVIGFVYSFFRFFVGQVDFATRLLVPIASLPLSQRLINIPIITLYYIKTFFFPKSLVFDQQWVTKSINLSAFYLPLFIDFLFFAFLGLSGLFIYKSQKKYLKPYIFFLLWFLVGLFFHLQIFPLDATVGDRWFYLTLIGLIGILCIILQSIILKIRINKYILPALALCVVLILSIRTIIRNTNWHDGITLFTHDLPYNDNYDVENSLGSEYMAIKDYKNALIHMKKSEAFRQNEFNLHDLGVIYENTGDMEKARMYFAHVFQAKDYKLYLPHKHDENSYKSYASILLYYNSIPEDESFLQGAISDYPYSSDLWMFMSLVKLKLHDTQGAFTAASNALKLSQNQQNLFIYQHILNNQPFMITLDNKSINFKP